MKSKSTKILRLPAYTTILCQTFSADGNYLAVGSDFGRIAIFKISLLVSEGRNSKDKVNDANTRNELKKNSSIFYFDVGSNDVLASREIFKVIKSSKTLITSQEMHKTGPIEYNCSN